MLHRRLRAVVLATSGVLAIALAGCSSSDAGATGGGANAGGTSGALGGNGNGGNGAGASGAAGKGAAGASAGASAVGGGGASGAAGGNGVGGAGGSGKGTLFRHGINMGAPPAGWTDQDEGLLSVQAGSDSNRIVLPEYFLEKWGVGVRTDATTSYAANGMSELFCFLIGPSRMHSTAPASVPDWQLDWYVAQNLHEPIFLADGSVNPANYWAAYVAETVTTYKPWIHVWEVWNEPDWVSDYAVTMKWATAAPTKDDLPRFNGSVFDYVRMLRITSEVAKKIDPNAKIALGGLGYPTFLGALLRYTDDPSGGAVSASHPKKADAYFDVMNYHYYPVFGKGSSDAGVDGFFQLRDAFAAELAKAGVTGKTWNVTETGAPRVALGTSPGGPVYAKNYLLKVMLRAQAAGFLGVDWFDLADGAKDGASQDPFSFMGLYQSTTGLAKKEDAVRTDTGWASTTLGLLWKGALYDAAATAALALPSAVDGGAFVLADGHRGVALWARATGDESATATYSLASATPVVAYAWDHAKTKTSTTLTPSGGAIALSLGATPQLFIVQ